MKFTNKLLLGLAGLLVTSISLADVKTTDTTTIINKATPITIKSAPVSKEAAGDAANGKKLFTASKCNQCHGTEVFTKKDRKVKDLKTLEVQVRRCDSNLDTNWFDDEIIDVTAHLNKEYYKFKNE